MSLDHVAFDDSDYSDTSLFTSLQFRTTRRLHVETGIRFAGEETYWKLGVRYYLPSWVRREEL